MKKLLYLACIILGHFLTVSAQYLADEFNRTLTPPTPAAAKIIESMTADTDWTKDNNCLTNQRTLIRVDSATWYTGATVSRNNVPLPGLTKDDLRHIAHAYPTAYKQAEERELAAAVRAIDGEAPKAVPAATTVKALVKRD